ncbi:reverse gyrase [Thermococcus sp. 18S1]|uniref:reverse gyrase n=1 Tax=Thermococcus sp. 18S1 TaxID=1638210 RepID=UPI001439FA86|nr:reverse gyrase [Thermococcus sp. 18S1]NJE30792.1 reverse gyrase [Thermococcus sp. 18S1]
MKAIYREMCPNCLGRISDERLINKNPCSECLDNNVTADSYFDLITAVRSALELRGTLKEWEKIYSLENGLREVEGFFEKATGFTFWSAQRTWVKRLLKGRSFSIIAPTGMGKSTFGAFMAVWHATRGKKSYIVVPTTPLVVQTVRKIRKIAENAGVEVNLAYYHGNLRKKEKEEMLAKIGNEDYGILVTSAQWMARKFDEVLKGRHFDFIFVDDVDAFLKASKNIDRSLYLLGFNDEVIGKAWEIIRLKKQMSKYLNGRAKDREERLKELNAQIAELQRDIEEFKRENPIGIMIIASATGSARGDRIKLYRELLGFEVGSGRSALRNVADTYLKPNKDIKEHVEDLLTMLGKGGIIFTPIDQGLGYAEELADYLRERGFRIELVSSKNRKAIERFENGEADYLIGSATYYGSLVRGLDMPHLIRYAIFTGVPKFRFSIDLERPTIYRALGLLSEVMDFLSDEDRKQAEKLHARLRRLIRNIPQFELLKIEEALAEGLPIENEFHNHVLGVFRELVEFLRKVLKDEEVLRKLAEDPFISLKEEGGKWYIEIPDVRTYIQATGRTSRLFAGGITKGLSVLIVDNEKVFNGLLRQMRWRFTEFKMVPFEELDLDEVLRQIDEDREKVRLVMEGKISAKVKDLVKSALMIVESPNKARTIANFFGQPSKTRIGDLVAYEVSIGNMMLTILASGGHMFDLVTNEGYHGVLVDEKDGMLRFIPVYDTIKRCRDCGHQFVDWEEKGVCPRCGSTNVRDALQNVKAMRELAQEVDEILIATDPDTEGEKIAWDIMNVLSPYTPNIKRIEFHEVTRPAIMRAIEEARDVNEGRVNAQIVRRIEDRWIGFELSQELQRVFENRNLSAGRVQTPVLGWVIERYKEFTESETYFMGLTLENDLRVTIELGKDGKGIEPPEYVTVEDVQLEERELKPSPPYTTDAMLKDASTFLKLSAPETMRIAQDLFEMGLITYHRTDSTHVSNTGIEIAKEYITQELGEEYFKPRPWGEEGTHEAIRPTRPIDTGRLMQLIRDGILQLPKNLTRNHYRLYDMIFKKFMTSQMKAARIIHESAVIDAGIGKTEVEGYVEVVEEGWTRLRSPPMRQLPRLEKGTRLKVVEAKKWKAPKVSLYTQGDIIALMKERKIGRPSTYAKIVQTLLQRYYAIETRGRKKLVPTDQGIKVYHYLISKYKDLVNEEKTRGLEEMMDRIEEGSVDYQEVLNALYRELQGYLGNGRPQ